MLSGQEIWLPHSPLASMGASSGAGPDGRQECDPCKHLENSLCDVARSVGTLRGPILGAQPRQDGREHAPVEHEEKMASIQSLAQGVLDDQLHINTPEQESAFHMPNSHAPSNDAEEGKHEIASEITSGTSRKDGAFPGLEMGVKEGNNLDPKLRQLPAPPPPNHDTPSALPLHLVPLLPQRNTPLNRRQPSIDPFLGKNDDDLTDSHGHKSLPHATSETPSTFQSEVWPFQTRAAGSSSISRTLAYAINQMKSTRPVGSPALLERDGKPQPEGTTPQFLRGSDHLGTGGVQADAVAATRDTMAQTDGEAKRKEASQKEELEFLGLRNSGKVTFADMGTRRIGEGEKGTKAEAWRVAENQDDKGPKRDQRDVFKELAALEIEGSSVALPNLMLAQSRTEELKEREMEIRRARTDVQILEERFQAIERDLCNRLETVRQGLEAIRRRKAFIDRQEDNLGQMLVAASREQEPEEEPEPKVVTAEQELQGVGAEIEADVLSEVTSRYTVKSVSSYKGRITQSSVLRDRNRTRNKTS
jgi:hypothetical protein